MCLYQEVHLNALHLEVYITCPERGSGLASLRGAPPTARGSNRGGHTSTYTRGSNRGGHTPTNSRDPNRGGHASNAPRDASQGMTIIN